MSTQNPPEDNQSAPSSSQIALHNWQQSLMEEEPRPAAEQPNSIQPAVSAGLEDVNEEDSELLACGLCYRPFLPEELTVASNERFNWEAAVVVCKDCLTELKLEMRAKSS